jgi:uncharacterized protein
LIVGLTGASGFVGQRVAERLRRKGHEVRTISVRSAPSPEAVAGCQGIVHLAGEPVAQRWTGEAKKRIRESRVTGTKWLVEAMRPNRPQVLVSASGVGIYGSRGDEVITEATAPATDFLGQVAIDWERAAEEAESFGVRGVRLRLGMVLGQGGGALGKMLLPFKLGLGGPIAGGQQWMSWIHLDDLVSMIEFMLKESTVRGAFNATSPHPVRNAEFTKALGQALHRPAFMPVPAFALRLMYGEMAETILASQRAIPDAAVRAGFTFDYPDVFAALEKIVSA